MDAWRWERLPLSADHRIVPVARAAVRLAVIALITGALVLVARVGIAPMVLVRMAVVALGVFVAWPTIRSAPR